MATMSARYTVIDGEVVAQERGGIRHQLVPDPLGSTVALYDSTGAKTDTFNYWPYGENAGRTGATVIPFQYIGCFGYYQDRFAISYVRARYLNKTQCHWFTKDPIGYTSGDFNLYLYAHTNPSTNIDPTGLFPISCPHCVSGIPKENAEDKAYTFCRYQGWIPTKNGHRLGGPDSTICNAFKHCIWACESVRHCGSGCAQSIINAHEEPRPGWIGLLPPRIGGPLGELFGSPIPTNPVDERYWRERRCMDDFNNQVGFGCADTDNCFQCCLSNARSGQLQVLLPLDRKPGLEPVREYKCKSGLHDCYMGKSLYR